MAFQTLNKVLYTKLKVTDLPLQGTDFFLISRVPFSQMSFYRQQPCFHPPDLLHQLTRVTTSPNRACIGGLNVANEQQQTCPSKTEETGNK